MIKREVLTVTVAVDCFFASPYKFPVVEQPTVAAAFLLGNNFVHLCSDCESNRGIVHSRTKRLGKTLTMSVNERIENVFTRKCSTKAQL